ncbi:MAG: cell division ATP-binding protein FtsE [Emcibacter sp.]|nr:cell division ATP-binding protein FtsE [Emcibacter sp.]
MIHFENVGMRYGMESEVLKDISFNLKPGSLHFLTGPSGAGKTSLLKLMYLAHRPSRGKITMFHEDVVNTSRRDLPKFRRKIGVVFQDFRLLDHLTAVENVALPLRIAGGKGAEIEEHVEELLAWVGLKGRMKSRPPTLSGGEKQRVAIARAVIKRPDLLLADEPTGNVDPVIAKRIMHLFLELNKLGTTTVIATHDMELVKMVGADRMHLTDGKLQLIKAGESMPDMQEEDFDFSQYQSPTLNQDDYGPRPYDPVDADEGDRE